MKANDKCIVFCSQSTADSLTDKSPELDGSVIATGIIPDGAIMIANVKDFTKFLEEKAEAVRK